MSSLYYNGVDFGYVYSRSLQQSPVYDPSGTDQIYTRVVLTVESVIYAKAIFNAISQANEGNQEKSLGNVLLQIEQQLQVPRRKLRYVVDGVEVLSPPVPDDDNGPKPLYARVTQLTEDSARIEWSVEVATSRGVDASWKGNPVASLRWSQTQDTDENGMNIITTSGRLVFRRSIQTVESIDELKGQISPPLPKNCIRTGRWVMQANGLAIDFTLTDREQYRVPEEPFVKISGTCSRSVQNGVTWWAEVNLRARWRKDFPNRHAAINQAIAIAWGRLLKCDPLTDAGSPIVRGGAVRENMYEPECEIMLRAQIQQPKSSKPLSEREKEKNALRTTFGIGGAASGAVLATRISRGPQALIATGVAYAGYYAGTWLADQINGEEQPVDADGKTVKGNHPFVGVSGIGVDGGGVLPAGESKDITVDAGLLNGFKLTATAFQDAGVYGAGDKPVKPPDLNLLSPRAGVVPPPVAKPLLGENDERPGLNRAPGRGGYGLGPNSEVGVNVATGVPGVEFFPLGAALGVGADPKPVVQSSLSVVDELPPYFGREALVGVDSPGVWTYYEMSYEYFTQSGRVPLASTSPLHGPKFPRIFEDVHYLKLALSVERIGGAPELPKFIDYDDWALLDRSDIRPHLDVELDPRLLVYKASGWAKWGYTGVGSPEKEYPVPPWIVVGDSLPMPTEVEDENLK